MELAKSGQFFDEDDFLCYNHPMFALVLDLSYFDRFLAASTPADVMIEIFRSGGWVVFLWVFLGGLWKVWIESRQIRWFSNIQTIILAIDVPKETEQSPKAVEHIFSTLHGTVAAFDRIERYWIGKVQAQFSFEIVSVDGYVQFFVRCWSRYRDLVEAAIYAQYPDAEIAEVTDYTTAAPKRFPHEGWDLFGTEFLLANKGPFPVRTYPQFEHVLSGELKDPLAGLLEGLAKIKAGEQLWIQIMISPNDGKKWRTEGAKIVKKLIKAREEKKKSGLLEEVVSSLGSLVSGATEPFFGGGETKPAVKKEEPPTWMIHLTPGERYVVESIQQKQNKVAFNTKIRIIYVGRKEVFSKARTVSTLKGAFGQLTQLDLNSFKVYGKVTTKSDYPWQRNIWYEYLSLFMIRTLTTRQNSILRAYRNRSMGIGAPPSILNIEELATLYHFPSVLTKTPLLKKTQAKRAEPPFRLPVSSRVGFPSPASPLPPERPAMEPVTLISPPNLPFV